MDFHRKLTVSEFSRMEVDWGRVLGAFFGFLLSIPAVFLNLTIRWSNLDKGMLIILKVHRPRLWHFQGQATEFPTEMLGKCFDILQKIDPKISQRWILTLVCTTM